MSRANLDRLGVLHWLAYVVGNFACAVFPNRFANSVLTSPLFPDGFADGVLTSPLFPDGLADRVANVFRAGFGNITRAGNNLVFTHAVVACLVTGLALLFPLNASDSLHHNVAAHLTARGATTVTCCTTVPGVCLSGNKLQSHAGDEGCTKKASHVSLPPFELWIAT